MLTLCPLDALEVGRGRLVLAGTANILLIRTAADVVHAYLNRCPHLGIPLAWHDRQLMSRDGNYLQCSSHGALFVPSTGDCIEGPCKGDQLWALTCTIVDHEVQIDEQELPTSPLL